MIAATPFSLHDVAHDGIVEFFDQAYELLNRNYSIRSRFENIDRQYQREVDQTEDQRRAKASNRSYDPTKYQNVIVPMVMPQVESATAYQTGVFLTGYPIFGVVASPQNMDAAMQMESIIADEQAKGGWIKEFIKFFRDGAKYNLQLIETVWEERTVATLEAGTGVGSVNAKKVTWAGNVIKRIDPYNAFWDCRYQATDVHKRGDFNGYTDLYSRVELKKLINSLPIGPKQTKRLKSAFESGIQNTYYIPSINQDTFASDTERKKYGGMNWLAWAGLDNPSSRINYKELYEVSFLNARIIPIEFGMQVPQNKTPQIWRFIIVNKEHVIYAERQTNIHDYLPLVIGQPYEDGLGYQTKSLAENVEPFQQVSSALMNANIASQRRAISDRMFYDPSRIAPKDINSDNPSAKIPMRPAAYGKPIAEAFSQVPFRNDQQASNIQDMSTIMQFSNSVSGQNPVRQGQFVKGNKTKVEFQDVMGNATARDQMVAMVIEDQTMTPVKEIIKSNILQYQGAASLYNRNKKTLVEVDPIALRNSVLEFKVSDGLIPSDKIISGDEWMTAMQIVGSNPQINQYYNFAPMFSYLMKVRGADLREFEKSPQQLAYEQALTSWQNVAQMIVESNSKNPENQQEIPPQPMPEQFGYIPGDQSGAETSDQV